jgi:predicted phage replisome organizer
MSVTDSKRYYWLKLKEDFFDDDAIDWLEEQTNGKDYVLFYLKLCLKSLTNEGMLIRTVGKILVPYDAEKLAKITKTNKDTVLVAMKLLEEIGLIEVQENGALYLTKLQNMIGSETKAAARMREKRAAEKNLLTQGGKSEQCSPSVRPMLEQSPQNCSQESRVERLENRDKSSSRRKIQSSNLKSIGDSEKNPDSTTTFDDALKVYVDEIRPVPSPLECEKLEDDVEHYGAELVVKAIQRASMRNKRSMGYVESILKRWESDGYDDEDKQKSAPKLGKLIKMPDGSYRKRSACTGV